MQGAADHLARLAALDGVSSAMAAARDGVDALLRDRGLRRTTPHLTAESLLRGAHASAALEGSTASLEDLRGGIADRVGTAALRTSAGLLEQVPTVGNAPLQALARLHVLAARGDVPDGELGRPRPGAGERLVALARLLVARTDAPAMVVAAIAHAELMVAEPFAGPGVNGLVARAMERLVLVSRRVDPPSLVVPEAGHAARPDEYAARLCDYRDGGTAGVRSWLLYAAQAYTLGAEASPLRG